MVVAFDLASTTCDDVYARFWADGSPSFYVTFLSSALANPGPRASTWEGGRRRIDTKHPLAVPIWVPGVDMAIPTVKVQRAFLRGAEDDHVDSQRKGRSTELHITESSRFDSIPYAAALTVETTWLFAERPDAAGLHVEIFYRFVFNASVLYVPGWIRSLCITKTKAELEIAYSKWRDLVASHLSESDSAEARVQGQVADDAKAGAKSVSRWKFPIFDTSSLLTLPNVELAFRPDRSFSEGDEDGEGRDDGSSSVEKPREVPNTILLWPLNLSW